MLRAAIRAVAWGLAGIVVLVIGAAAVWTIFPNSVPAVVQYLSGKHTLPPAIAQGAQFDWRFGAWTSEPKWTEMLRRHFPVGSNVEDLETVLREQDFKIDEEGHSALYEWSWYPCAESLRVDWKVDAHKKITRINGGYGSACL